MIRIEGIIITETMMGETGEETYTPQCCKTKQKYHFSQKFDNFLHAC